MTLTIIHHQNTVKNYFMIKAKCSNFKGKELSAGKQDPHILATIRSVYQIK